MQEIVRCFFLPEREDMEGDAKEQVLPRGFRFHPTDEELVGYYLTHKIYKSNFTARAIAVVDLNKCEPWDLAGKAKMGEKEWYFFSLKDRKYPTGLRTNRATSAGYWKTTGKDKEIFNSHTSVLIGMKKTLVFYMGRAPRGEKTNWVMHEYCLQSKSTFQAQKDWVVCRVFKKSSREKRCLPNQSQPDHKLQMSSAFMPSVMQANTYHLASSRKSYTEPTRPSRGMLGLSPVIQPQFTSAGSFTLPSGLSLCHPTVPAMEARTNCILPSGGTGFGLDIGDAPPAEVWPPRVDSIVELEKYWPPYLSGKETHENLI